MERNFECRVYQSILGTSRLYQMGVTIYNSKAEEKHINIQGAGISKE